MLTVTLVLVMSFCLGLALASVLLMSLFALLTAAARSAGTQWFPAPGTSVQLHVSPPSGG